MKKLISSLALSLCCLVYATAYGGVPPMSVSVSDESGKGAYKGATNSNGNFATAKLTPGKYTVQINSKSPALKGKQFAVVLSAGKKKVAASSVPGEKFIGGGVALKVDVANGLNITGQVAEETKGPTSKDGKKMVWIPPALGSNLPGRWVPEDSAEAKEAKTRGHMSSDKIQQMQDKAYNPQG
jgi:hypothetical protein